MNIDTTQSIIKGALQTTILIFQKEVSIPLIKMSHILSRTDNPGPCYEYSKVKDIQEKVVPTEPAIVYVVRYTQKDDYTVLCTFLIL